MEFLISNLIFPLIVSFISTFCADFFKGDKSLKKEVKGSYLKALKKFSKNKAIRSKISIRYGYHFSQLELFIISQDINKVDSSYRKLILLWYDELKNNQITYNYIKEKLNIEIIELLNSYIVYYNDEEHHFEFKPDYITRNITMKDEEDFFFSYLKTSYKLYELVTEKKNAKKEFNEIQEQKDIPGMGYILYSGAQTGKSTELYHLAFQLQKTGIYKPCFFNLNNFTPDIFKDFLRRVIKDPSNTVLLLDGYDEIKDSYKDDFVNSINSFINSYPNLIIVITSRINFENKYNFKLFQPLYLEPLSFNDIHDFIELNFPKIKDSFIQRAYELGVFELFRTPFFLKESLKYYSINGRMPENKSHLYKLLIEESFNVDEKHKQSKGDVRSLRSKGVKLLQKAAFVMTASEKIELTEEEFFDKLIINDAQLVCHFGIFRKDNTKQTYGFEHIAFKEYLVAEMMISLSQSEVQKLIFYPESNRLINSWYNIVLLFIELVQDDKDKFNTIIDILIENNERVIIESSPGFLGKQKRIDIFIKVFNYYKDKGLYIDYFQFRKQLMLFANYQETILYLVDQLKLKKTNTANLYNALVLLEYSDYECLNIDSKNLVKEVLKHFLIEHQHDKGLKNYILLPFENAEYNNVNDIENLGEIIKHNKRAEVLDHYFDLLLKLDDVDKYAEWIFEAQHHIRIYVEDGVHHSINRESVYDVYDKFKSKENILTALQKLASEVGYLSRNKEDQLSIKKKLFNKLSEYYLQHSEDDILERVLQSFELEDFSLYSLNKPDKDTLILYKEFFEQIGQTCNVLDREYELNESSKRTNFKREMLIPLLMYEAYFINKMNTFNKEDVNGYWVMRSSLPLDDLIKERLSKVLDDYFKVPMPKVRDANKEKQEGFDLVLDYHAFKSKIEEHCNSDCELIYLFRKDRRSININDCVDVFFYEFTDDEIIAANVARDAVNDNEKYNKFLLEYISRLFKLNDDFQLTISDEQSVVINKLVRFIIGNGIVKDNIFNLINTISYNDTELLQDEIKSFIPYSYLNLPNDISFKYGLANKYTDELAMSHNVSLLDFLIHKSSKEFIEEQIEDVLRGEIMYDSLFYVHVFRYIIKNKILGMYNYLPYILFDIIDEEFKKRNLLYTISRIEDSYSLIMNRFEELSDETKVSFFSAFKNENMPQEALDILWNIYPTLTGSYKEDCLSILLRIGHENGLDAFISYLNDSGNIYHDKFMHFSYIDTKYLDALLNVIDIVLGRTDPSYFDNRLMDALLHTIEEIAILSKENLSKVKSAFERIIFKYNNFYFLNRNIITFTDKYYESGRYNLSIREAVEVYHSFVD